MPVFDSVVYKHSAHSSPLAGKTIEQQLVKSLKADAKFTEELGNSPLDAALLQHLKENALQAATNASAAAETKPVTVGYGTKVDILFFSSSFFSF